VPAGNGRNARLQLRSPLRDCPPTLLSLVTRIRECKVVLVNNRYVIVEPSTRRIMTVIER
jgi:hypothetical protein